MEQVLCFLLLLNFGVKRILEGPNCLDSREHHHSFVMIKISMQLDYSFNPYAILQRGSALVVSDD